MIENILEDLKTKINFHNPKIKYYTEGATESIVFSLDNKYLIKTVDENTLKTQVEFLKFYQDNNKFQKLVTYNEKLKYICFEFLEGEKYTGKEDISVIDIVKQIYEITSSYKKYEYAGFGYLYEDILSWSAFLKSEVDYSKKAIESLNLNFDKVSRALDNIDNYKIDKYLIHGDFGTHNFLINNNEILVIDPMPVVGDRIYDFYFALFSNVNLFNKLDKDYILSFFNVDKDYKRSLMIIVLFIRLSRCYVYHKEDLDIYLEWFRKI